MNLSSLFPGTKYTVTYKSGGTLNAEFIEANNADLRVQRFTHDSICKKVFVMHEVVLIRKEAVEDVEEYGKKATEVIEPSI